MTIPILKFYPSAPLESIEKDDLEKRLEKELSEANSYNHSIKNIKEMNMYLKEKNH